MQRYRPSGHVPLIGIVLMIPTVLVGAVLIGGLYYVVARHIYIMLMFPALLGTLCGAVLMAPTRVGKIRDPLFVGVIGVVLALLSYGAYLYYDYWFGFRGDFRKEIEADYGHSISDQKADLYEDIFLRDEVGSTGFIGYLKFTAKAGLDLESTTSVPDDDPEIQGTGIYIYWLAELLFASMMGFMVSLVGSSSPFSEETNEWFGKAQPVGIVPPKYVAHMIRALETGDYAQAGRIVFAQFDISGAEYVLNVRQTTSPTADLFLTVQRKTPRQVETVFGGLISADDFSTLKTNIRQMTGTVS